MTSMSLAKSDTRPYTRSKNNRADLFRTLYPYYTPFAAPSVNKFSPAEIPLNLARAARNYRASPRYISIPKVFLK